MQITSASLNFIQNRKKISSNCTEIRFSNLCFYSIYNYHIISILWSHLNCFKEFCGLFEVRQSLKFVICFF